MTSARDLHCIDPECDGRAVEPKRGLAPPCPKCGQRMAPDLMARLAASLGLDPR